MNGRIKKLYSTFGFIAGDDGVTYFWHDTDLVDDFDLKEGDAVRFEVVVPAPEKGPRASQVALA